MTRLGFLNLFHFYFLQYLESFPLFHSFTLFRLFIHRHWLVAVLALEFLTQDRDTIYFDNISTINQKTEREIPTPRMRNAGDKSTNVSFLFMASSGLSTLHSSVALTNFTVYAIIPLAHIRFSTLIKNHWSSLYSN